MTSWWAIDTGISRNACALARGEKNRGGMWRAEVWCWQGSTGSPLRIEAVVAPEVARLMRDDNADLLACDGFYLPELRRGLGDRIATKRQTGKLRDVYWHARYLTQEASPAALYVVPVGRVWTDEGWRDDPRAGERVTAGLKAVQRAMVNGELSVSLPEAGASHHDEAVAVMRMLWSANAAGEASSGAGVTFGAQAYATQARGAGWYPTPGY